MKPYPSNSEKIQTVISDLRKIGEAIESFAVDNNRYPNVSEVNVIAETIQLTHVEDLESQLVVYANFISPDDPWGNPYLYWTSGQTYVLVSTGSDGMIVDSVILKDAIRAAKDHQAFFRAVYADCLEDEVIFSQGSFLRFPKRLAEDCKERAIDK